MRLTLEPTLPGVDPGVRFHMLSKADFTCFTKQTQIRLHVLNKADTDQTAHAITKQTQIRLHVLHKADTDQTARASQSRHRSDCTCFQCSERIGRFVYKMQTPKRFKRKLFIWTKHNIRDVMVCLNK